MMENREKKPYSDLENAIAKARVQRPVGSPCIDVCRLNAQTGYCEGCLRNREEIKAWRAMSDREKLHLLDRLVSRGVGD
ncbi:MAG TPA: DUF1289 domain-containing protein [Trinickia sp.]|jgi:predicted Fe-S protein YdhL (DUF1289 family)|uniref:DUF1289 domain-containing protein n=1 Tax=Trinickia sp. TaxID=2571163 RepID=UPI002C1C60BA|nr:DUF1289 domain-containing protein [Trinickia sp.]HTI17159.1 DUF1289 domain-containing protein [Trinickia sp.]